MPHGRRLNTHTSGVSQTHNWSISTLEQNEALPNSIHSAPSEQRPKRKRGPCRGLKTSAIVEGTGKIQIYVCPETGRVDNSANSSLLSHECGYLVKRFAPLRYKKWKSIPTMEQQVIFHRLLAKFEVDLALGPVQKLLNYHFGSTYRRLRHLMYVHYQKFPSLEEAKLHPHDYTTKNDWEWLCDNIFSNEEFQKRCANNKQNRNKLLYKHCGGSRPFAHHRVDSTTTDIELFEITHFSKKKKTWVDENAKSVHDQMKVIEEEQKELPVEERLTDKAICQQVLGKKSGYVRGLGYGPKPTPVHSKDITTKTHRMETIVTTQAAEIEEQEKQIEEQEKELGDMKARMTEFESMMRLLMSQSGSSQATQATFSQLP